jgi:phosphate transport system substrate-binding protein
MKRKLMLLLNAVVWSLAIPTLGATLVRVCGVETMKGFGQRLTDWYAKKNPALQFEVTAAAQANSFAAVAGGKADLVLSSRKVLPPEVRALHSAQNKSYLELEIAKEVAAIFVNAKNPVRDLSIYQLREVLSGSTRNWKQLGGIDAPIIIYGLDDHWGARTFIEEEFMGDASIAASARSLPSSVKLMEAVASDPNGIGFGDITAKIDAHVRYIGIKPSANAEGITPSGDSIRDGRYKLVRPLYLYFAGTPKGDLRLFAEWVLSPEGQLVVESVGYFPLSSTERETSREALKQGKTAD